MSLTIEDVKKVEELLKVAKKDDVFNMTTRKFNEFENIILDTLYEQLERNE